jgi:hypothetical protein
MENGKSFSTTAALPVLAVRTGSVQAVRDSNSSLRIRSEWTAQAIGAAGMPWLCRDETSMNPCSGIPDPKLPEVSRRHAVACEVVAALSAAVPLSEAGIRGSLATGNADVYSDIDILWVVPDDCFTAAVNCVQRTLALIGPVASLRYDPDFQESACRRIIFARFSSLPLFWRVDLEVLARLSAAKTSCEVVRGEPAPAWSRAESALSNAVAAIKACKRGQPDSAKALLERALQRLGSTDAVTNVRQGIVRVAELARNAEPATYGLAERVLEIIRA